MIAETMFDVDASRRGASAPTFFRLNRSAERDSAPNQQAGDDAEFLLLEYKREPEPAPSESAPRLAGMKLAEIERLAIMQTLGKVDGNRTRAARELGISVRTLQRKLRMWRNAD